LHHTKVGGGGGGIPTWVEGAYQGGGSGKAVTQPGGVSRFLLGRKKETGRSDVDDITRG